MYKFALDLPNCDKGRLVELDGLGIFENGKTYELTKAEVGPYRAFAHNRGITLKLIKNSNSQPTLPGQGDGDDEDQSADDKSADNNKKEN